MTTRGLLAHIEAATGKEDELEREKLLLSPQHQVVTAAPIPSKGGAAVPMCLDTAATPTGAASGGPDALAHS